MASVGTSTAAIRRSGTSLRGSRQRRTPQLRVASRELAAGTARHLAGAPDRQSDLRQGRRDRPRRADGHSFSPTAEPWPERDGTPGALNRPALTFRCFSFGMNRAASVAASIGAARRAGQKRAAVSVAVQEPAVLGLRNRLPGRRRPFMASPRPAHAWARGRLPGDGRADRRAPAGTAAPALARSHRGKEREATRDTTRVHAGR
jgi:hypothetical protein